MINVQYSIVSCSQKEELSDGPATHPGHALIIGATLQTVGALIRCVKPAAPGSAYLASRQNILPNSPWF